MTERDQLIFDSLRRRAVMWMGEVIGSNFMVDISKLIDRAYERGKKEALASK